MTKNAIGNGSVLRDAWRASSGGVAAVIAFGAVINALKFAMPLYTIQILDRIPDSRSMETLVMLTVIAILAVVAGVSLDAVRRRMLARWGGWIERQFGPRLFYSRLTYRKNGKPASPAQPLADLSTLRGFVTRSAAAWLDVVWAPVFVIAVFLVHPVLGVIQLVAIALLILLGILQEKFTRDPRRASGAAANDAKAIVRSTRRSHETVRGLGMAAGLTDRWKNSTALRLEELDRTEARTAVFSALILGLYRCLYVGGLGAGIWLAINDSLSLGGVIAGNIMIRFGFRLVARPARKWRSLVNARRAYQRLSSLLARADQQRASVRVADLEGPLSLENVSHRYGGQPGPVFRHIDVIASPGEILCVTGPSAAGKSTLSRLITGIFAPRSGRARLGDIDISRLPPEIHARLIGYLPQQTRFFKGTIRQNIARMSEGDFEDIVTAARLANIHDTILALPKGYDTVIDDEAAGLSGGEIKRIALARAYFRQPLLMVLDEPEAHLDRRSRKVLIKALQFFRARGSIIVVTTQSSRLGKIADQVLILGGNRAQVVSRDDAAFPAPVRIADARRTGRAIEPMAAEEQF
jgi:ATP-binding cassette, subfamily C, type I secretion system permease/ATPase